MLSSKKEELTEKFVALTKRYGDGNVFCTWMYCSEYDCKLNDSIIDQVRVIDGEIVFVYNHTIAFDSDYLCVFNSDDVEKFYNDLVNAIEKERQAYIEDEKTKEYGYSIILDRQCSVHSYEAIHDIAQKYDIEEPNDGDLYCYDKKVLNGFLSNIADKRIKCHLFIYRGVSPDYEWKDYFQVTIG